MQSREGKAGIAIQDAGRISRCGCAPAGDSVSTRDGSPLPRIEPEPNLDDLILIALVVAAGCEPCAEKAVARALEHGCPTRHI